MKRNWTVTYLVYSYILSGTAMECDARFKGKRCISIFLCWFQGWIAPAVNLNGVVCEYASDITAVQFYLLPQLVLNRWLLILYGIIVTMSADCFEAQLHDAWMLCDVFRHKRVNAYLRLAALRKSQIRFNENRNVYINSLHFISFRKGKSGQEIALIQHVFNFVVNTGLPL